MAALHSHGATLAGCRGTQRAHRRGSPTFSRAAAQALISHNTMQKCQGLPWLPAWANQNTRRHGPREQKETREKKRAATQTLAPPPLPSGLAANCRCGCGKGMQHPVGKRTAMGGQEVDGAKHRSIYVRPANSATNGASWLRDLRQVSWQS